MEIASFLSVFNNKRLPYFKQILASSKLKRVRITYVLVNILSVHPIQLANSNKFNKTKIWRDKACDCGWLKYDMTKADPKSEDNDDTKSLFSELTFTVADSPAMAQAYLVSAAMGTATSTIPEDPTIKGIFDAAGAWMKVSDDAAPLSTDIIIIKIPNSQATVLSNKGATIVDQGGNYSSMSMVTLSTRKPGECHISGDYRSNHTGEVNPNLPTQFPHLWWQWRWPQPNFLSFLRFVSLTHVIGEA